MSDDCKYKICSDASSFMLFPTSDRTPEEAYNPECLVPTVKHGGASVKYLDILLVLWQLWVVELLLVNTWTFQVTRCILWSRCHFLTTIQFSRWQFAHTHTEVFSVSLRTTKMHCNIFPGQDNVRLKYHRTTVASCRQYGDKHSPSSITSQATRRCSSWTVVLHSTEDCSELVSVYCKKDTSCITGKWWPNSVLVKKCVYFTTVSFICPSPVRSTLTQHTLRKWNKIKHKIKCNTH